MTQGYADITVEHINRERTADVTDIVAGVSWAGDTMQVYRSLSVSLRNTTDGRTRRINFENGDVIRFFNHGKELFRGSIFGYTINDEGAEDLTVYDFNAAFTKSQTTQTFRNVTASNVVRRLSREFGIATGDIAETGFVIPKLIAEQDSLSDVIVRALTITERQNGRRFRLINRLGNVHLEERLGQVSREVLENGVNILSATYSQSIEDLRNRLVMSGGPDGQYREVRVNNELIDKYGTMQADEQYIGNKVSRSEVKQAADQLFRELTQVDSDAQITCLGIDGVTAGSAVYVIERMTGIVGGYYVTADTHTYSEGRHEMTLTLSKTDDLPTLELREEAD